METREVTASSEGRGNISVKGPRIKACLCFILNALFFAQFITPAEPFARSSLSFSSFCVFLCTWRNATIVFSFTRRRHLLFNCVCVLCFRLLPPPKPGDPDGHGRPPRGTP
ncbi:unnamed protein product [Ectocarpus sp. 12 AP-2014]